MKASIKKTIVFVSIHLISILLVLILELAVSPLPTATRSSNIFNSDGEELAAVCISDLEDCQYMPYINYTPNEFIRPSELKGTPIKLEKNTLIAPRGTIKFIILNLDPSDEEFYEKKEQLEPYLEGDRCWHFTLQLPAFFSACNVYVRSVLTNRVGEIENYDYIEYGEYQGITENHKSKVEPLSIDLNFYSIRHALTSEIERRALVVTLHYETEDGKLAGFTQMPLIGMNEKVKQIVSHDQTFLIIIALTSALVASILAFVSLLKKDLSRIPLIIISLGIGTWMLSKLLLLYSTTIPYLFLTLEAMSITTIILASLFTLRWKIKKFPIWIIACLFGIAFLSLVSASATLPQNVQMMLTPWIKGIAIPLGLYIFLVNIITICQNKKIEDYLVYIVISVLTISLAFTSNFNQSIISSNAWLLVLTLCITTYSAFSFFIKLEQQNKYLTNNLQTEVSIQTKELQKIIDDRERLLRYLSHDMKKPVSSIRRFLSDLKNSEKNEEKINKLIIVEQKIEGINQNLLDLQKFSKQSFSSEKSSRINIAPIISKLYENLNPDCEANNIYLKYTKQNIFVYAKKDTLLNVLNNLIFNAIEHANCKTIEITAAKSKNNCKIMVIDDGKGIDETLDIFQPYSTEEKDGDNLGLGLYICKQLLSSMGGNLTYNRKNEKTIFTITLALA